MEGLKDKSGLAAELLGKGFFTGGTPDEGRFAEPGRFVMVDLTAGLVTVGFWVADVPLTLDCSLGFDGVVVPLFLIISICLKFI